MQSIRKVLAALRKADEQFSLIEDGDKIALGVSGGKDSMCLLKALSIYGKFAKKNFTIFPIMLDLGFDGFDSSKVERYCGELGLSLQVVDNKFVYGILLSHQDQGKHIPCSICSRMKKAGINDAAKKLGCNKVAFAHHKDDAIETLFMNMVHGGRIATFEPKMTLERAGVTFIRPLILCGEKEITKMVKEEHIPVLRRICPADGETEREEIKEELKKIYKSRPESEKNFLSMLSDYKHAKLFYDDLQYQNAEDDTISLHPLTSPQDVLEYDELREAHRKDLNAIPLGSEAYIILRNGRTVGAVSIKIENPHQVNILQLDVLSGAKPRREAVLRQIMYIYSRQMNPCLFVYQAIGKEVARHCNYKQETLENGKLGEYTYKSIK
ncbi:MAG: tRNA 2-thiocytidine biosynthesis TtcA family protein [Bacillota bacterium]|nr:tRNA 2-thiocytidine biosynthesis TtcA family protein [Bacillota bacterium]